MIFGIEDGTFYCRALLVLSGALAVHVWLHIQYFRYIVMPRMIRNFEKNGFAELDGRYYKVKRTPAYVGGSGLIYMR